MEEFTNASKNSTSTIQTEVLTSTTEINVVHTNATENGTVYGNGTGNSTMGVTTSPGIYSTLTSTTINVSTSNSAITSTATTITTTTVQSRISSDSTGMNLLIPLSIVVMKRCQEKIIRNSQTIESAVLLL